MTAHFEAKKHAYRQTQDGIVISFVIHPNDMEAELATAALGTRYMVAFSQIGDDGKPVIPSKPTSAPAKSPKTPEKWADMKPSKQAGIRCNEIDFWSYLNRTLVLQITNADVCAHEVRRICKVESRSEFDTTPLARQRWNMIESGYDAWKLEKQYADTRK